MADGSSADGSPFSLPPTPFDQKQAAATAAPGTLQMLQTVTLSQGFAARPIIQPAPANSADYYRDGNGPLQARTIEDFADQNVEASIRVIGKTTPNGPDVDLVPPYSKFILENATEAHAERKQIVQTFGDFYVFFFGEEPPVYNFSGTLINSSNANWVQDFMFYYENYLRGTQCVYLNARLVLTYGGRQIEGFMLNTSNATVAVTQEGVQFSFQVLILDRKYLGFSQDFGVVLVGGKLVQNTALLNTLSHMSNVNVSGAFVVANQVLSGTTPPSSANLLTSGNAAAVSSEFGVSAGPNASGGLSIGGS